MHRPAGSCFGYETSNAPSSSVAGHASGAPDATRPVRWRSTRRLKRLAILHVVAADGLQPFQPLGPTIVADRLAEPLLEIVRVLRNLRDLRRDLVHLVDDRFVGALGERDDV